MAKREKIDLKYLSGKFVPASKYAMSLIEHRRIEEGQIVRAEISKLRSNSLNKHAHNIAKLCIDHIDDFSGYQGRAHDALKRLQLESGIECDELMIRIEGFPDKYCVKQARSFSFENMGEERFNDALIGICRHISKVYWPTCSYEDIGRMADSQVNE